MTGTASDFDLWTARVRSPPSPHRQYGPPVSSPLVAVDVGARETQAMRPVGAAIPIWRERCRRSSCPRCSVARHRAAVWHRRAQVPGPCCPCPRPGGAASGRLREEPTPSPMQTCVLAQHQRVPWCWPWNGEEVTRQKVEGAGCWIDQCWKPRRLGNNNMPAQLRYSFKTRGGGA